MKTQFLTRVPIGGGVALGIGTHDTLEDAIKQADQEPGAAYVVKRVSQVVYRKPGDDASMDRLIEDTLNKL